MGNSESYEPDPNEIPIKSIHICSENCAKKFGQSETMPGMYTLVDNPTYIDGKCDESGTEVDDCVYISSFDESDHQILNPNEIVITDTTYDLEISYPLKNSVNFVFNSPTGFTRLDLIKNIIESYRYIYKMEEETASENTYCIEKKCTGCQETVIEPTTYTVVEQDLECAICLDTMSVGTVCSKLVCKHMYHQDCIKTWFDKNAVCPLCKKSHIDIDSCGKCDSGVIKSEFKCKVLPVSMRRGLINRPETNGIYGIWGHDIGDLVIEGMYYDKESKKFTMSIGS